MGPNGQPPSSLTSRSDWTVARFGPVPPPPPPQSHRWTPLRSPPSGVRWAGPLLLHPAPPWPLKRGRSPPPHPPPHPFSVVPLFPSQGAWLTRLHPPLGLPSASVTGPPPPLAGFQAAIAADPPPPLMMSNTKPCLPSAIGGCLTFPSAHRCCTILPWPSSAIVRSLHH
jgi:hypothetical protein